MKKKILNFIFKNIKKFIIFYFGCVFLFLGFLIGVFLYIKGYKLLPLLVFQNGFINFSSPSLLNLLILGWIDGINPCAIGVMLLFLGYLLVFIEKRDKAIFLGIVYIAVVYITYFLIGLGFGAFVNKIISSGVEKYFKEIIGVLLLIVGILNIKDFFFEGVGPTLQIPQKSNKYILNLTEKASLFTTIILGILVTFLETPCSFPLYMLVDIFLLQSFHNFNFLFFFYLALYNLVFILPLILVLYLVFFAGKLMTLKEFQHTGKKWLKLIIGSIVFLFGIFIFYRL